MLSEEDEENGGMDMKGTLKGTLKETLKGNGKHGLGIALAAVVFLANYSPVARAAAQQVAAVCDGSAAQEGMAGAEDAVKAAAALQTRTLIPGGQAVGVALRTRGVMVVAGSARAGGKSALRVGDVIVSVGGASVTSAQELAACLNEAAEDEVTLGVRRGDKDLSVKVSAPVDASDGKRRLGVWVRDSTAGVGTLSYIDPASGRYGALGHAIVDGDTGGMLEVSEGAIMRASVVGVTRGQSGKAGELKGSFLRENEQIGTLERNSVYGIYGCMQARTEDALYPQGLPVGTRESVHPGEATILTTVDESGPAAYSIQIVRCFAQDEPSQKGMILRVTDERLLEKTGGIVQGMSGSPILQDGHIVGAVTHVYLSDAAQGYGMYIEWMLEQSDGLAGRQEQSAA